MGCVCVYLIIPNHGNFTVHLFHITQYHTNILIWQHLTLGMAATIHFHCLQMYTLLTEHLYAFFTNLYYKSIRVYLLKGIQNQSKKRLQSRGSQNKAY